MIIKEYELILTSTMFPEQYDVLKNNQQVGYLRLRHGIFRADCPDCGDKTVHVAYPMGKGTFYDEERERYLTNAIEAIDKHISDSTQSSPANQVFFDVGQPHSIIRETSQPPVSSIHKSAGKHHCSRFLSIGIQWILILLTIYYIHSF